MTKPPHLSQISDNQPSEAESTYEIGYCRPPVHSRVKPGQVLNPRGRPKGQRNIGTVLRKALNERTRIREGTRTRSVTKLDAIVLKMINDAGMGNPKAQASLIALMRAVGMVGMPEEPSRQEPLTADDQAVILEFFERSRNEAVRESQPARRANSQAEKRDRLDNEGES